MLTYYLEALKVLKSVTDKFDGRQAVLNFEDTQATLAHLQTCAMDEKRFNITQDEHIFIVRSTRASFANFYLVADRLDAAENLLRKGFKELPTPDIKSDLQHIDGLL